MRGVNGQVIQIGSDLRKTPSALGVRRRQEDQRSEVAPTPQGGVGMC
jgi:hypothetical protein